MPHPDQNEYDRIAELAYRIWEAEGCPEDRALEHWSRAERTWQKLDLRKPRETSPHQDSSAVEH